MRYRPADSTLSHAPGHIGARVCALVAPVLLAAVMGCQQGNTAGTAGAAGSGDTSGGAGQGGSDAGSGGASTTEPTSGGAGGAGGGTTTTSTTDSGTAPPKPPCSGATVATDNLQYAPTHERNKLDLYLPASGEECPLVLWIHGGGWKGGQKELGGEAAARVLPLVQKGYAVASINYRLSGDAAFPAQIHDVKAAIRFLRAHAAEHRLDPERFAVWGASAGGHLAALAGTSGGVAEIEDTAQGNAGESSSIQAVIDCYGPTDLPAMDAQLLQNGCGGANHSAPGSPESSFLGCDMGLAVDCPQAATASPLTYVDAADPPFLFGHGLADCIVPWQQSQALHDTLGQQGVPAQIHLVPDSAHELGSCPPEDAIDVFLADTLK